MMIDTFRPKPKMQNTRTDLVSAMLRQYPHWSKFFVSQMIKDGHVSVNWVPQNKNVRVLRFSEDVVQTQWPFETPNDMNPFRTKELIEHIVPEDLQIPVLYEDVHLIALNKPAGVPTQPNPEQMIDFSGSCVNHLKHLSSYLCMHTDAHRVYRPGISYVLDTDCSGVLLCAKSNDAGRDLGRQLFQGVCKPQYLCLVEGNLEEDEGVLETFLQEEFRLNKLHAFQESEFKRFSQKAKSSYQVLERFENRTLVKAWCESKHRPHQIRAQFASLGHPIVGDSLYGPRSNLPLHIHCAEVTFVNPSSKQEERLQAECSWSEVDIKLSES